MTSVHDPKAQDVIAVAVHIAYGTAWEKAGVVLTALADAGLCVVSVDAAEPADA